MNLFLCDDTKLEEVALLARANRCGIEVQSFYDPDVVNQQPNVIFNREMALQGITLRALHGPFADLCPGSMDSMVRAVARNRFDLAASVAKQLPSPYMSRIRTAKLLDSGREKLP